MRTLLLACPLSVIAVALPSQTTHLVGPGGLPQIRDALAIAQPGDRIHVQPGTYAHFEANVGVTIRALTPGTVDIAVDPVFLSPACMANPLCAIALGATSFAPPVGQTVHVVGLRFAANETVQSLPIRHRVSVTSGRVTFDSCEVLSLAPIALGASNATLVLQDCLVAITGVNQSGFPALHAASTTVHAVNTTVRGGDATSGAFPLYGTVLFHSELHATDLTVTCGTAPGTFGGYGLTATVSPVWLTDSTITGPCAIGVSFSTPTLQRCSLTSTSPNCQPLPPGPQPASLLAARRTGPLLAGAPFQIDYVTEPNGIVLLFASPELGRIELPGLLAQPSLLDEAQFFFVGAVLADAAGNANVSLPIPALPTIVDLTLWFKGLAGWTFPLQVSPVVGGVVR